MKRTRVLGLCLVAAIALSLTVAVSAQAGAGNPGNGPEYGKCKKKAKGDFADANCTTLAPDKANKDHGKFEFVQVVPGPTFSSTSVSGIAFLELENGIKTECNHSTDVGKVNTATTNEEVITLAQCEVLHKKCNSPLQPPGTIKTELESVLGWVRKATNEVGVDFNANLSANPPYLVEFECPGSPALKFRIQGSAIGRAEPINVMTVEAKQIFQAFGGHQAIEKFEGGPKDTLVGEYKADAGPWEPTGGTNTVLQLMNIIKNNKVANKPNLTEINTIEAGDADPN
jgi:hypothetical protein